MGYYPQFDEEFVLWKLPMRRGWAYLAAGMERDGWLNFSGVARSGKGYIQQEIKSLLDQVT